MRVAMLMMAVMILAGAAQSQTWPTTAPASELLAHNAIAFTPPPNSELIGKRPDDLSAGYAIAIDAGQILVTVAPQKQAIPKTYSIEFASQLQQTIRDEAAQGVIQTVMPPKVESDKRFFLRVHDQFKIAGRFNDRLQLFRAVGNNLVSVTIISFHDDADVIRQIHEMGENVMLSVDLHATAPTTQR